MSETRPEHAAEVSDTGSIEGMRPEARQSPLSDVAGRLQQVFDATDRAVAEIRAAAEAEAARYLEQRKAEADRLADDRLREAELVAETRRREATAAIGNRLELLAEAVAALRSQAERVKTDTEEMDRAVKDALAGVSTPVLMPEPPHPEASAHPSELHGTPNPPAAGSAGQVASAPIEEAMLRATQMAVAGSTREEIEGVLRSEYRVFAPGPIVDEILGSGTG